MKTRMLWLLCCVVALSSQAQTTSRTLWVWKDANGVTHYSDKPEAGAKRMVIAGTTPAAPQSTETSPPSASEGEGHSRGDGAASNPPAQIVRYESLAIDTPTEEQTFFGADGVVPIQVSSNPELADGDTLVIYLDGKPADAPENSYQVTLSGVERGEHVLTASILDSQGKAKIDSAPRSFFMRVDTISNPRNVGPSLKPKPTPHPAPTPSPPPPKAGK